MRIDNQNIVMCLYHSYLCMSRTLKTNARPWVFWSNAEDFNRLFDDDGLYYNIPRDYFDVENETVYLHSDIAHKLPWTIHERLENVSNIVCAGGTVQIDNELRNVNPGFWCSYIENDLIK